MKDLRRSNSYWILFGWLEPLKIKAITRWALFETPAGVRRAIIAILNAAAPRVQEEP